MRGGRLLYFSDFSCSFVVVFLFPIPFVFCFVLYCIFSFITVFLYCIVCFFVYCVLYCIIIIIIITNKHDRAWVAICLICLITKTKQLNN